MVSQIDAIFFEASATRSFASEAARQAFRERWLGRFLCCDPDETFLAIDEAGRVLGYLVGARDDPAQAARFSDIPYFQALADLTCRYPAHLHINLAPEVRGQGIGARLVEEFCNRLRALGVHGVHVVTGAGSRNRSFYGRMGFQPQREMDVNGGRIVMLGRGL
jgi:GNAT superfamily N-acetyltransferase